MRAFYWFLTTAMLRSRAFAGSFAFCVLCAACSGPDPVSSLADARQSYAGGEYREAMIHVQNVLQQDSRSPGGRALLGRLSIAAGDFGQARGQLEFARELGSTADEYALPLARSYLGTGEPARASELLDSLPDTLRDGDYWRYRAEAFAAAGAYDDAEEALSAAIAIDGETAPVLITAAGLAVMRGDALLAESLINRVLELEPANADALAFRGSIVTDVGRLEAVAADLARAADLYRNSFRPVMAAPVLLRLVQVQLALNQLEAASETSQRLTALVPNAAFAEYAQGLVAYQRGDFDETIQLLRRALNRVPSQPQLLALLGASHLAVGNFGQAEQQFLAVLRDNPSDPAALRLLVETRVRQERPQAALDALRLFGADLDNEDFRLLTLYGAAYLQNGEPDLAIPYLEQAFALNPTDQTVLMRLVQAYTANGRSAEADELLRGADIDADSAYAANVAVVLSHLQDGNVDQARSFVEDLLASEPNRATSHVVAAIFERLNGDNDAAKRRLDAAVTLDDGFVPARLFLATILAAEGRIEQAESQLVIVTERDPQNIPARMSLSQLALERGDLPAAQAHLEAVSSTESIQPQVALARLHLLRGQLDAASEMLARANAVAPDDPEVLVTRGMIGLARGEYGEAAVVLGDALARAPDRPNIALLLAQAHVASGKDDLALETLNAAVDRMPGVLGLRAAQGAAALRTGSPDQALRIALELQTEFGQQPAGYMLEGQVRMAERRYDQAARSFQLSYERDRSWTLLLNLIAARRLSSSAGGEAALVRDWLKDNPGDVRARLFLAELERTEGEAGQAVVEYRRVLELDENNVVALNNAAWAAQQLSMPEALDYARRAASLAPDNAAVLDTLGWILVQRGRPEEGLPHLTRATQLSPQTLEIVYHLGSAQAQLGQTEAARETLESLLSGSQQFDMRESAQQLLESL